MNTTTVLPTASVLPTTSLIPTSSFSPTASFNPTASFSPTASLNPTASFSPTGSIVLASLTPSPIPPLSPSASSSSIGSHLTSAEWIMVFCVMVVSAASALTYILYYRKKYRIEKERRKIAENANPTQHFKVNSLIPHV